MFSCILAQISQVHVRELAGFFLTVQSKLPIQPFLKAVKKLSRTQKSNLKSKLQHLYVMLIKCPSFHGKSDRVRVLWHGSEYQVLRCPLLAAITASMLMAQVIQAVNWIRARVVYAVRQTIQLRIRSYCKVFPLNLFSRQ